MSVKNRRGKSRFWPCLGSQIYEATRKIFSVSSLRQEMVLKETSLETLLIFNRILGSLLQQLPGCQKGEAYSTTMNTLAIKNS